MHLGGDHGNPVLVSPCKDTGDSHSIARFSNVRCGPRNRRMPWSIRRKMVPALRAGCTHRGHQWPAGRRILKMKQAEEVPESFERCPYEHRERRVLLRDASTRVSEGDSSLTRTGRCSKANAQSERVLRGSSNKTENGRPEHQRALRLRFRPGPPSPHPRSAVKANRPALLLRRWSARRLVSHSVRNR